jgi:hypothetical protein
MGRGGQWEGGGGGKRQENVGTGKTNSEMKYSDPEQPIVQPWQPHDDERYALHVLSIQLTTQWRCQPMSTTSHPLSTTPRHGRDKDRTYTWARCTGTGCEKRPIPFSFALMCPQRQNTFSPFPFFLVLCSSAR